MLTGIVPGLWLATIGIGTVAAVMVLAGGISAAVNRGSGLAAVFVGFALVVLALTLGTVSALHIIAR